jgi:chemotaxis protein methyltransferase CheR
MVKANSEIEQRKETEKELNNALSEIKSLKSQLEEENIYLQKEIKLEHNFEEIIGNSSTLKYVLYRLEQVAPTEATVLIQGETGSGKELIARAIHNASPRSKRPMLKVDCASLPANLIESELFGHEKGAFTTALSKQLGRFELANGSTIFLDEIGELPLEIQSKLLGVIQDGQFQRIGNPTPIKVDVRIIAATNRDLEVEIGEGRFRHDLFYRLSVFPITVPPLRQRSEDIPLLVHAFLNKMSKRLGKEIQSIPPITMQKLKEYNWPGNIRELENIIERSIITSTDNNLLVELPKIHKDGVEINQTLEDVERGYILKVLFQKNWQIAGSNGAAELLGINPSTLRSRIKKLGIEKPKLQPH